MNTVGLSEDQRARIARAAERVPFGKLLGLQLTSVEPGLAQMKLPVRDELRQNHGIVHGGAIASLIDSVAAFAVIPLLRDDETATTVDLSISFLRPLSNGLATATAKVQRAGTRIVAVSIEVVDDDDKLIATALTTYLRMTRRPA